LLRSPISQALVLAGACLLAIVPFFWWGIPSGHDFEFHMFSWMEVLGQWKHGIAYPRWAALAHWGYGEARFLFYPPASWILGAALGAVLPWPIVPGAYCWIVLTLAGAAMYRLAREWLSVPDAMFAAVFYALNPYHLLIVYWRSAYAELLAAPLLPLVLLCLIKLQEPAVDREVYKPDFRSTLCLSLLLAAAWLTNAPAAMMIHYSTAGLALLLAVHAAARNRSLSNRSSSSRSLSRRWGPQIWRPLLRTGVAIVLGIGLASFYLLPTIYEQKWIDLSQVMSPGVRPQDNFLFTKLADPDHNRFNLLVSILAAIEIGALVLVIWVCRRWQSKSAGIVGLNGRIMLDGPITFSDRGSDTTVAAAPDNNNNGNHDALRPWVLLSAWGMGSALLMLSLSNFFWQHLPKFRFVQLPFRWLLCMNVVLAMLLTVATKRWTLRLLAFGVLLTVLIVVGYRTQPPWWATAGDIHEMSDAVVDGTGYEGTDEYVPAGADAYELKKDLSLVSDESGAPIPNRILEWGPIEKHFIVEASEPERLQLRLFGYPAWQVTVNGQTVQPETADITSQMILPILKGTNDVRIRFRRTTDRTIGDAVSFVSLTLLAAVWIKTRHKQSRQVS
jgi:hypothetical protein